MKQPDESVYLQHILDAIAKVETYLQGLGEETFYQQTLVQDGVIRQMKLLVKRSSIFPQRCAPSIRTFLGMTLLGCAINSSTTILA
jgi:hypothetical protein